jgi:ACR3 family arsenite efflux pump ArsB
MSKNPKRSKFMARTLGKNKWALFLLILAGIVVGSFIGHLVKTIHFLSWLNYGIDFAIGKTDGSNVVSLDLGAVVVHFGIRIKITIASVIGAIASVIIYKKL